MKHPCAKQRVIAVLVGTDGTIRVGENWRENDGPCMRLETQQKTGWGYEYCKDRCRQQGHAEEDVLAMSKDVAKGSIIYIFGHYYACEKCIEAMKKAGVEKVVFPMTDTRFTFYT